MLVLLGLSTLYFFIGLRSQKQARDWKIQKNSEIVQLEIKNLLYTTNQLFREKIHYFVTNPKIKKQFAAGDAEQLYKTVFPYYSVLKAEYPFSFIINFYYPENQLLLKTAKGPEQGMDVPPSRWVSEVNATHKKLMGFGLEENELIYIITEPVFYNSEYIGCVEFGIHEKEIVDYIHQQHEISIASVFQKNALNEELQVQFDKGLTHQNKMYRPSVHSTLFPDLFAKNHSKELPTGLTHLNDKVWYLNYLPVENIFTSQGFVGIYLARDVSKLQNQYLIYIYKSLLIISLILIAVFLILYFSFNNLLDKFFNLQHSLDAKIAEKSKEIIDTNTELNQIFNTTGNSMRLISKDYSVLRVNRSFTNTSGISKEDAEGKKCYDVFPGPYCHTAECPINRIKNGEELVEQDIKKRNKSGKIIPGILTAVAFKGENGELLGVIEDYKDISQRIAIEEALKKSEKQFSVFMDNLPLGIFIKDEDGKAIYLNKYMDTVFSKSDCMNKTPQEIFPSKFAKRVIKEDKQVLDGKVLVVEEDLPDKEGNLHTYMTHKFRFIGTDNKWKIGGVSLDITRRKETEYKLHILSNAIHHSPVSVAITNLEGSIEYVNPAFTEVTAYKSEEVLGEKISILRPEKLSDTLFNDIMEYVKTGEDWQGEFNNRKKTGELYWELTSISAVRNEKNEITHFVFISENISDRKKSEKELINAKEKAEEADNLKSAFLANLSHEIRTPLNAIIGFSNLFMEENLPEDERKRIKNLVVENSNNLLKLIDDVIDISKIQNGEIAFHKTECELNGLLEDVYNEFQLKLQQNQNKKIGLSLHKGIKDKNFKVITDPSRLRQVVYNLVENAIKFTDKGFVEVGYSLLKEKEMLQFYVIDSGIGINKDKFGQIYEIFRQADDSSTREYGGIGIGLSIAKKIIKFMGGDIWVQSTPKEGTSIYFTIPLEINEPKFDETGVIPDDSYDWHNKVVLVAEDLDMNYVFIQEALSPTKAKVIWARDGKEAVEICKKNDNIDLVLMDIKMPVMDGFEATKEIKRFRNNIRVIGQTAYVHDNEEEKCMKAGFDSYISKPIHIDQLLQTISKNLIIN